MKQTHFYLRDRNGHPIGVVAMRKEANGVRVAASLCAATDPWDKHVGVAKAVGRLDGDSRMLCPTCAVGSELVGLFQPYYDGGPPPRLSAVDQDHASRVWFSQYHRLTTPRPA